VQHDNYTMGNGGSSGDTGYTGRSKGVASMEEGRLSDDYAPD